MSAPPPNDMTPPTPPPVTQNAPLPSGPERGVVGKLYNSVKGFFGQGGRMTKRMMKKMTMMKKKAMIKKKMMKKKAMIKKKTMKKKMMKKKLKAKTRKSRR